MAAYPEQIQHGSGATLTLEPGLAVASLRPGAAVVAETADLLQTAGLVPGAAVPGAAVTADSAGGRPMSRVNDSERLRWVRVQQDGGLPAARASIEATLGDRLDWLGAVYRFPGIEGNEGLVCPLPDALLVRVAERAPEDLDERLGELGLEEDAARSRYLDGRLEVFVIGSDHALHHNWQVSAGGGWSGWRGLGGWIDRLADEVNTE